MAHPVTQRHGAAHPVAWLVATVALVPVIALHLWGLYRVTGPTQVPWFPGADKVQHVVGFGVPVLLALLAAGWRALARGRTMSGYVGAAVIFGFAAHAVVSEVIQHLFYRSRNGDVYDVLADLAGITIGVLAAHAILRPGFAGGAGD